MDFFDKYIVPVVGFFFLGILFGGEIGAFIGIIIGGIISISHWKYGHKHTWERGVVYAANSQPQFMVKFCKCGEMKFDGWFKKEEN